MGINFSSLRKLYNQVETLICFRQRALFKTKSLNLKQEKKNRSFRKFVNKFEGYLVAYFWSPSPMLVFIQMKTNDRVFAWKSNSKVYSHRANLFSIYPTAVARENYHVLPVFKCHQFSSNSA